MGKIFISLLLCEMIISLILYLYTYLPYNLYTCLPYRGRDFFCSLCALGVFFEPKKDKFYACSFQQDYTRLAEKCLLVALAKVLSSFI